jgi:hypothetical protein
VRYLVVIPFLNGSGEAAFHDVEADQVAIGDQLLLDELAVRVQDVVHIPAEEGYVGTVVCTTD